MSSAYGKSHTAWQRLAALTAGVTLRKRSAIPGRLSWILAASPLIVAAAIAAVFGYQALTPTSHTTHSHSTAALPVAPAASSKLGSALDLPRESHRGALGEQVLRRVWPAYGQAAFAQSGQSDIHAGPNQHAAPIASLAKVMTAYLVLRSHPLEVGESGPTISISAAAAADSERRRDQGQSVVSVVAGERLTELQALQALMLPSANNIADVLARWDSGSQQRFVARMNATARSLRMRRTQYTDPSGFDAATVSSAADQVRIVEHAMRLPVFAAVVRTPSVTLPVAGIVHNTDSLLGRAGFVGVKTGSDDAAGGCFAFRSIRYIRGERTTITGVVLGQPGDDQVAAGLTAADDMVNRLEVVLANRHAERRAASTSGQELPDTTHVPAASSPTGAAPRQTVGSRLAITTPGRNV
jgi:D-alanyl-D-alanine carboxypeptidase (penicillin-binding protein 5/6)